MTGNELFEKLQQELIRIGITPHNLKVFQDIKDTLIDFNIIDFFAQIKKNDKGEGLALEIMLFNEYVIHDIVFSSTDFDYITLPIKKVNLILLSSSLSEKIDETNSTITDKTTLTITYGGELKLFYNTVTKRLNEMLRIKNNLIKTISK